MEESVLTCINCGIRGFTSHNYYYYYYLLIGIRKTKSYKNQSQVHLNKIKPAVV